MKKVIYLILALGFIFTFTVNKSEANSQVSAILCAQSIKSCTAIIDFTGEVSQDTLTSCISCCSRTDQIISRAGADACKSRCNKTCEKKYKQAIKRNPPASP